MHRYLLIGYVIAYCIFALFLFIAYAQLVPEEEKKTDKPWEALVDVILVVVGLVGMLFLLCDLNSSALKFTWRPVSIALAITQLYGNLKDRFNSFAPVRPSKAMQR